MYVCMYVYIYSCMYLCMYVSMFVCMYVLAYTYCITVIPDEENNAITNTVTEIGEKGIFVPIA